MPGVNGQGAAVRGQDSRVKCHGKPGVVCSMAESLGEANRTMDAMLTKIGEQAADIAFFAERIEGSGCRYQESAGSIIAIAYGRLPLEEQVFPSDASDLDACRRMLDKLPPHRLTKTVHEAMFRATQALAVKQREFAGRS